QKEPTDDPAKVSTAYGEMSIKAEIYRPIIAELKQGPRTVGQLQSHPDIGGKGLVSAIHTLMLLVHIGAIGVGRSHMPAPEVAQRFNAAMAAAVCQGAP